MTGDQPAMFLQPQGRSATASMDTAIDYLRDRPWRVLGPYLLGMVFYSLAILAAIDVVTSQNRTAIEDIAWLLTAATVWRWAWIGVAQKRVLEDLRGEPVTGYTRRLGHLLVVRLLAMIATVWGGLLVLPACYGLFLSGFAAPMLLAETKPAWTQIKDTLAWITKNIRHLSIVSSTMTALWVMTIIAAMVSQWLMVQTVLPSLLGFDAADLKLTISGWPWLLTVCYFVFVVLDLYWCVLTVVLFDTLRSHHLGNDLRLRLRALEAPAL